MDVKMPDGTVIRNVPEGTSRAQIMARYGKSKPQAFEPKYGLGDYITHSATFGADSLTNGLGAALVNAIEAPLSGKVDFHPLQAFNDARRHTIDRAHQYEQENPGKALAGGLVGAFTSGPGKALTQTVTRAPGFFGKVLQSAKVGAGAGATQAALNTKDVADIPGNAEKGGLIGGAIGAAMPPAFALLSPIAKPAWSFIKNIASKNPGAGIAEQKIAEALQSDGVTPRQAGAMMDEARSLGVPRMLADTGENTRRLLGAVSRQPGPARTMVRTALKQRQLAQGARLQNFIERDMGPVANVGDQSAALIEKAKAEAAPIYRDAYRVNVPNTPRFEATLGTPAGQSALSRAKTIALNDRVDPAHLGFSLDANGAVVLNPVPTELHANVANTRVELDDATNELRKARASVLGGGVKAGTVPDLERRVAEAAQAHNEALAALNAAPSAEAAATNPVYTQRTLDYVKRGLDDQLEPYRNKLTGKLELDEMGNSINGVLQDLKAENDLYNPTFKQARATYEGPAKEKSALLLGQSMVNASDGDIQRAIREMTPSQRSQFALGMRSKLSEDLDRRVDGANKVNYLRGSEHKRDILQQAAGPDADLERFFNTLGHEDAVNETFNAAMGGSPTAINLADDELVKDGGLAFDTTRKLIHGAKAGGTAGAIANVVAPLLDAARFGVGATGNRVRQDLASYLLETEPASFSKVLDALDRANSKGASRSVKRGLFGLQSNLAGGSLAGQFVGSLDQ